MQLISRASARAQGLSKYYTGKPCLRGHVVARYVCHGHCVDCHNIYAAQDYAAHGSRISEASRRNYVRHRESHLARRQSWSEKNRARSNAIKRRWKQKHREKAKRLAREYQQNKCAADPVFRLSCRLSKAVWAFLKGGKGGRKWRDIVGYNLLELKQHLESKFKPEMNWENYGQVWELDHIRPKSWFLLAATPEDTVRSAWALANLQPLECSKNRSKCNRYEG